MKKRPLFFTRRSIGPMLASLPTLLVCQLALAQTFNPPPSDAPGNREAGAARSDTCASTQDSSGLLALMPETNLGLTTKAFPTFAFYVPPNNAERLEFRLYDEETNQELYGGQVNIPATTPAAPASQTGTNAAYRYPSAIVSLSLPQDQSIAPLEAGKRYLWALMMVCNAADRAEDVVVTGVVQRVDDTYVKTLDPALQQKLNAVGTASEQERLSTYGAAGLWQDLISEFIRLNLANGASYQPGWHRLLTDQGLGAIVDAPLLVGQIQPL